MSYSEWSNFAYYNIGDIATYAGVGYEALQANQNVVPTGLAPNWKLVPTGGGSGIQSLNTLTDPNLLIKSSNSSISITQIGTDTIDLAVPVVNAGIQSINNLIDPNIALKSPDGSVAITDNGADTIFLKSVGGILNGGFVQLATGVVDILVDTGITLSATPIVQLTWFNDGVAPPTTPFNGNPITPSVLWYDREANPTPPSPTQFWVRTQAPAPAGQYYTFCWALLRA